MKILYIILLNLLFFIYSADLIINCIERFYFVDEDKLTFSNYIYIITYYYGIYILSTLLFFSLYKSKLKEKILLFVLNVIIIRATHLNEVVTDFIMDLEKNLLHIFISFIILFVIIYNLNKIRKVF